MNRGHEGRIIFIDEADKDLFVELINKARNLTHTSVMAYCILDNHYHLLIQNISERMPDFFKLINGEYAVHFRKKYGGKGYVFQDRYQTKLIQDESYMMVCLAYILNNPVKAGLCRDFLSYRWSSALAYFTNTESEHMDCSFFEELFENRQSLYVFIETNPIDELPQVKTELGWIIGGDFFISTAKENAERRGGQESFERRRNEDQHFEPVEKVIFEFEKKHGFKIDNIPIQTHQGKRLRGELLVHLKDRAGLYYREIAQMDIFGDLKRNSLGSIYKLYKKKLEK